MSITGVSITKSTSFRGIQQEFANTYYYQTPLPITQTTAEGLIDAVVAIEKPMHSTAVNFVRGRAWSAGGTPQENEQLAQKNIGGAGTNVNGPSTKIDKERAFLVRARAGNDSRGRPVYLRKWWHLDVTAVASQQISDAQLQNTASLSTAIRDELKAKFDSLKNLTVGAQQFQLTSSNGRQISGDTQAHAYLEHHQLGDMWR
jgi:hypothetical protein